MEDIVTKAETRYYTKDMKEITRDEYLGIMGKKADQSDVKKGKGKKNAYSTEKSNSD